AQSFTYEPDEALAAQNVWIYSPLLFLPFGFWMPVYRYELGSRRVIWNFPVIGLKKAPGWGYYMQNTFDYDLINGQSSQFYFDVFQSELIGKNRGVGLGIKHHYQVDLKQDGYVYYYRLFEGRRDHQRSAFSQSWQWNDFLKTQVYFDHKDAIRISSLGQVKSQQAKFDLHYDELGERYDFLLHRSENQISRYQQYRSVLSHQLNNQKVFTWTSEYTDNQNADNQRWKNALDYQYLFANDFRLDSDIVYQRQDNQRRYGPHTDEGLKTDFQFSGNIHPDINLNLRMDTFL
ncbi:unnamed protein product, partial [marine sediment metagenome]